MRAWRICAKAFAASLDGVGGQHVSGRWHERGHRITYTAATASLAALEALVHFDASLAPRDLCLVEIDIPDDVVVEACDPSLLSANWRDYPAPAALQAFGTKWLSERRTAVLSVPSAVLPVEWNHLVNPAHPDACRIQIAARRPFSFDPRLTGP